MQDFNNLIVPNDVYASYIMNNSNLTASSAIEEMHQIIHPCTLMMNLLGPCYGIVEEEMERPSNLFYHTDMAMNIAILWGTDSDINVVKMVNNFLTFIDLTYITRANDGNGLSEAQLHAKILSAWSDNLGKKYRIIKHEYILPDGDRIDILAECLVSKRPVIIEIKKGVTNAYKQLSHYASFFKNPIKILISMPIREIVKRDDIIYINLSDVIKDT